MASNAGEKGWAIAYAEVKGVGLPARLFVRLNCSVLARTASSKHRRAGSPTPFCGLSWRTGAVKEKARGFGPGLGCYDISLRATGGVTGHDRCHHRDRRDRAGRSDRVHRDPGSRHAIGTSAAGPRNTGRSTGQAGRPASCRRLGAGSRPEPGRRSRGPGRSARTGPGLGKQPVPGRRPGAGRRKFRSSSSYGRWRCRPRASCRSMWRRSGPGKTWVWTSKSSASAATPR